MILCNYIYIFCILYKHSKLHGDIFQDHRCSWNPLGGLLEMARNWKFASKAILPLGSARILVATRISSVESEVSWQVQLFSFRSLKSVTWICGRIYIYIHIFMYIYIYIYLWYIYIYIYLWYIYIFTYLFIYLFIYLYTRIGQYVQGKW